MDTMNALGSFFLSSLVTVLDIFIVVLIVKRIRKGIKKRRLEKSIKDGKYESDSEGTTKRISNFVAEHNNFAPSLVVNGPNDSYLFATDDINKQILLLINGGKQIIRFEDVISVEVLEDKVEYEESDPHLSSIIWDLVVPPDAASDQTTLERYRKTVKYRSISVNLLIHNAANPSVVIPCFDINLIGEKKALDVSKPACKKGLTDARTIYDKLRVIIASNNSQKKNEDSKGHSVSDELLRLVELKEKGGITEEEYNSLKQKLLVK